jgi:hypothetical protein
MNPLLHSEISRLDSSELDRAAARRHVAPTAPRRRPRASKVRRQLRLSRLRTA